MLRFGYIVEFYIISTMRKRMTSKDIELLVHNMECDETLKNMAIIDDFDEKFKPDCSSEYF